MQAGSTNRPGRSGGAEATPGRGWPGRWHRAAPGPGSDRPGRRSIPGGRRARVKTPPFPPAGFGCGGIADEDALVQARCGGVLGVYVGKMDRARKFILQRPSSQAAGMISSHYRPQTRLLAPDDSKLEGGRAVPADTWAP